MGFEPGNIYSWHGITTSTHTHPLHTYVRVCELHLIGAVAVLGSGGIANLYGKQQQGKSRKLLSPICILNYIHCWCSLALNPLSLAPLSLSFTSSLSSFVSPGAVMCADATTNPLLTFWCLWLTLTMLPIGRPRRQRQRCCLPKGKSYKIFSHNNKCSRRRTFFFCIFYIYFFLLTNYRKYSFHFNFARQISERKMQLNIAAPRTLLTN